MRGAFLFDTSTFLAMVHLSSMKGSRVAVGVVWKTAVLVGLFGLGTLGVNAQTIAESAATTSTSSVAAQGAKPPSVVLASPAKPGTAQHLLARTGPPLDEINRKEFEANAGENASKLLLRSAPTGAEIFINGLLVGKAPLLMVIAPGKYDIEMRGQRLESGRRTVGIMPKETQTVVIDLNQRYPASISTR
jgi:PEGA domain